MANNELSQEEKWWVAHQPWLASLGYQLRPRYQPGWQPSWYTTGGFRVAAEDGYPPFTRGVLDATRLSDGAVVMMKRVPKSISPREVELTTMLNSPPLSSDPRNHCIPLYEVLQVPDDDDIQLMVLPLLRRYYANPRFDTVGEAVHCLRQIMQCVQLLHENKIAHRDIHAFNIMMDASPLSTVPFHPTRQLMRRDFKGHWHASYTRTQRPVKYYIIDFGLSMQFDAIDPPPLELPILGGDRSVPEYVGNDPAQPFSGLRKRHNPFFTDIYCLGNWIREDFLDGSTMENSGTATHSRRLGMEFLRPLVDDMTQADPSMRPTIEKIVDRFEAIVSSLSSWKLRSRIGKKGDHPVHALCLSASHWKRRVRLILDRQPAIPSFEKQG